MIYYTVYYQLSVHSIFLVYNKCLMCYIQFIFNLAGIGLFVKDLTHHGCHVRLHEKVHNHAQVFLFC